jgi:serine/threonine protein kinase
MLNADIGFDCPIGHYKKVCPLAFTNYSQVFIVYDIVHRVRRIMKVIPQADCCSARPGEAFLASALDRPYVARALETLEWGRYSVLIFPRFTGGSMCDAVRNKKYRTIASSAEVTFRLALAVRYLHRGRILHGDISPNNVLFENDAPVLINFGTAEILQEGGRRTSCCCSRTSSRPSASTSRGSTPPSVSSCSRASRCGGRGRTPGSSRPARRSGSPTSRLRPTYSTRASLINFADRKWSPFQRADGESPLRIN